MAREDFMLSHQSFRNGKYADGRVMVETPGNRKIKLRKHRKEKTEDNGDTQVTKGKSQHFL